MNTVVNTRNGKSYTRLANESFNRNLDNYYDFDSKPMIGGWIVIGLGLIVFLTLVILVLMSI